jgi:hypothetical protein
VLLWLACLWIGVSLGLGFLLQHYFVPTATIATLLSGLAVGWIAQATWSLARRWLAGTTLPAPPIPDPVAPGGAVAGGAAAIGQGAIHRASTVRELS